MISCFGLRNFSPPQQLRRPAVPFGCSSAAIKLPLNKLVAPDSTSCLLSTLSRANVTQPAVVLGSPARQIVESHEFISYSPLHPIPICHFYFFFSTEPHLENIWKHVLDLPKNPAYVTNTQVNSLDGQFHGCARVDFTFSPRRRVILSDETIWDRPRRKWVKHFRSFSEPSRSAPWFDVPSPEWRKTFHKARS